MNLEKLAKEIHECHTEKGALLCLKEWHKELMEKLPKRPRDTISYINEGRIEMYVAIMQHLRLDSGDDFILRESDGIQMRAGSVPCMIEAHIKLGPDFCRLCGGKHWELFPDKQKEITQPQAIQVPKKFETLRKIDSFDLADKCHEIIDCLDEINENLK